MKTIKELKRGELFTKKDIQYPTSKQVWMRGDYIRELKKYELISYDDMNRFTYLAGNKPAFTDFIF